MNKLAGFFLIFTLILIAVAKSGIDVTLTTLIRNNHTTAVVTAIFLTSFLLIPLFETLGKHIYLNVGERMETKRFLSRAKHLSPADKYVISLFVDENKLHRSLEPSDPSVAWLESTKIILRSGETSDGKKVAYRINLFAMDYFSKNPNLLR